MKNFKLFLLALSLFSVCLLLIAVPAYIFWEYQIPAPEVILDRPYLYPQAWIRDSGKLLLYDDSDTRWLIWDSQTKQIVEQIPAEAGGFGGCRIFGIEDYQIFYAPEMPLISYNFKTGQKIKVRDLFFLPERAKTFYCAISQNKKLLAVALEPTGTPGENTILLIANETGYEIARLSNFGVSGLAFSPDDSRIAFSGPHSELYTYDLATQSVKQITFGGVASPHFTWSPDGQYLAYARGSTLAITPTNGTNKIQVISGVGISRDDRGPLWSPDGKFIAIQGVLNFNSIDYRPHYRPYLIELPYNITSTLRLPASTR